MIAQLNRKVDGGQVSKTGETGANGRRNYRKHLHGRDGEYDVDLLLEKTDWSKVLGAVASEPKQLGGSTLRKHLSLTGLTVAASLLSTPVFAEELIINLPRSTEQSIEATENLIAAFKEAHPGIEVTWNNFDDETYKASFRNFLAANPPDVVAWFAGNRMRPFVEAGLFEPIDDLWAKAGFNEQFSAAESSMTIDGNIYGVPYQQAPWAVFFNRDVYERAGASEPANFDEFVENCEKFAAIEVDCLTTGTVDLWPGAGIFDLINLRTHGFDFHMQLAAGEIEWTDPRVRETFENWGRIAPYITADNAAIDWDGAAALLAQGKAANYVIGAFAVKTLLNGGMTEDSLGMMSFPTINADVPRAEEAPMDSYHIPVGAPNPDNARLFLEFVGTPDQQTAYNATTIRMPVNNQATPVDDKYLNIGFEMLSTAEGLSQFFDRDADADMAKAAMEGFQEFMARPERMDDILERLEATRQRIYK
ncbi:ABC transporter substrate-binding protein [uncultured Tateyamaria sp.]|uniref:ABC transporter substrate-binding protein n=1 Tax=uncultured Tateyamaria sp. TaxID=455651 RepID=UPI0026325452|nr:ABC transporter substrate-binding protein [uncultured Tateyamaria sp.]